MLSMDVARLQSTINSYVEKTNAAPSKAARGVMLTINRQTILTTPTDTGRLVGSWIISANRPSSYVPTVIPNRRISEQAAAEIKRKTIEKNAKKLEKLKDFSGVLYFTTAVRYSKIVEFGAGRRVGKFMLSKAVQIAIQKVRNKIA